MSASQCGASKLFKRQARKSSIDKARPPLAVPPAAPTPTATLLQPALPGLLYCQASFSALASLCRFSFSLFLCSLPSFVSFFAPLHIWQGLSLSRFKRAQKCVPAMPATSRVPSNVSLSLSYFPLPSLSSFLCRFLSVLCS